jgi:putative transposase
MGRVGCALDNAAAGAFNSTIKVEYIHRQRFRTRAEARLKIATWIVDFYNVRQDVARSTPSRWVARVSAT